jgi:hypothetical protein
MIKVIRLTRYNHELRKGAGFVYVHLNRVQTVSAEKEGTSEFTTLTLDATEGDVYQAHEDVIETPEEIYAGANIDVCLPATFN